MVPEVPRQAETGFPPATSNKKRHSLSLISIMPILPIRLKDGALEGWAAGGGWMPSVTSSPPMSGTTSLSTTGSTAPVLEYLCLFTRDLRRKQKRWQDGRLKYHTFNKRIMVYDDRGNFVGDTHWRDDCDLGAGEEVELERGGVIVQISDCVGRQTQDLSELIDKPLQEKQQRHAAAASRTPAPSLVRRPDPRLQPPPDHFQLRHRPLKDLIGAPTTSRSKDQGAIQPGRSRQNHPPHLAASLGQTSHRRRKEASQCSETLADETPQEKNRPCRSEETVYHHSVEEDIDDVGTTDGPKDGPVLPHNDNATGPVAPVPAGPRLIRLGRKSVKSRELIGFVPRDASAPNGSERSALIGAGLASEGFPLAPSRCNLAAGKPTSEPGVGILSNDDQTRAVSPQPVVHGSCHAGDHQPPRAKLLTQELARPASTTPGCLDEGSDESGSVQGIGSPAEAKSHSSRHSEQNLDQTHAPAVPKPDSIDICDASAAVQGAQNRPSKLPNPATRGRKAALKADAAGQAPQSFLPVDTTVGLVTRSGGGSSSATPGAGKNEPARRKMTFPGFVSVGGGGPWSREAHDLLATGRPG
ncbi:protein ZGRF1 [Phialemonium atrogriseum]|uniref:Protein ZGRF1 n=1 Tax=Phialemonium atrogriseum TaxID=1093897 RepID=A0AAJ0FN72_9PEZI|nr:protein ZGRF1 [Phialemonium atrogriseum]KAK1769003.1 protein ZGRF1 [Phialemonium atrogriseum]